MYYRLIKFLNKHMFLQGILVSLPTLISVLYIWVLGLDLLSLNSVFVTNDRITKSAYRDDLLIEIEDFEQIENSNDYKIKLNKTNTTTKEVEDGDLIYSLYRVNDNTYYLSPDSLLANKPDNIEVMESTVSYGGIAYELNSSLIYSLYKYEDKFKMVIGNEEIIKDNDTFCSYQDNKCIITTNFDLQSDNGGVKLNYCTNLPHSCIYYNYATDEYFVNLPDNYWINFIRDIKFLFVVVILVIYNLIIFIYRNQKDLIVLKSTKIAYVNLVFSVILILFTFLITKCFLSI